MYAPILLLLAAQSVFSLPIIEVEVVEGPIVLGGEAFRVVQINNPGFTGFATSGPAALAKALTKFNVSLPSNLAELIQQYFGNTDATSGTVSATPLQFDREYLSPVQIGTPAQTLQLDFDTGSSDLWVFSSQTPNSQENGQVEYNPSKSSTAQTLTGATWSISYGDGSSSSGDVFLDKVSIGAVTVSNQAVESAEMVSSSFSSDTSSSGLLGLGFNSINTVKPTKQNTFFENAINTLASPVFTANLKKAEAGNYNFGYIDTTEFTGTITYTPVDNSNGFWGFTPSGYAVGTAAFNGTSFAAIADTGTSLLLLPDDIVDAYYAQVSGAAVDDTQGGFVFPCSATLPDFTFGVGSYRGVIPGDYMNYATVDSTNCFGGIQSNSGVGFSIFGDVALKAQFVVFDGGNTRLGFAAKPV